MLAGKDLVVHAENQDLPWDFQAGEAAGVENMHGAKVAGRHHRRRLRQLREKPREPFDFILCPILAGRRAVDADIARAKRPREAPRPLPAPRKVVGPHHEPERIEAPPRKQVVRPHGANPDVVAEHEGDAPGGFVQNVRTDADGNAGKSRPGNLLQGAGLSGNRDDEARDAIRDSRRDGLAGQLVLGRDHAQVPSMPPAQIAKDSGKHFPSGITKDGESGDDIARHRLLRAVARGLSFWRDFHVSQGASSHLSRSGEAQFHRLEICGFDFHALLHPKRAGRHPSVKGVFKRRI